MNVVNIVTVKNIENVKMKMFAAIHWSLLRWYEEGKMTNDDIKEEEVDNKVDSDIDRQRRNKRANDTYEEEKQKQKQKNVQNVYCG